MNNGIGADYSISPATDKHPWVKSKALRNDFGLDYVFY